ncbi:hypothetical protein [Methanobrevibacter sp.]|uniref:hypothetical protein n=1 Tax=Methanobrevibacter sp. TaxID=66852 RepID=UPI00388ED076
MLDVQFSDKIVIAKDKSNQSIELDQRRVKIREKENGLMALSYVAPVFEAIDLENFFSDVLTSEKLVMNIGGAGDLSVSFRGIVDGKDKNFPQNMDHKIILLQEPKFLDPRMNIQTKGFSRFKLRDETYY